MSVRAKFALIVALCVLPLAGATFFISRALEREQGEDALERVRSAQQAFESSLADDVDRLRIAARMLTSDSDVVKALDPLDKPALAKEVQHFADVWPGLRVSLLGLDGAVVAATEDAQAEGGLAALPEVRAALAGKPFEGVVHLAHGWACVVVRPIEQDKRGVGAVLAAFPLDNAYFQTAEQRHRLGLSLASGGELVARSSQAPTEEHQLTPGKVEIHDEGGRVTAQDPFAPSLLRGALPAVVTASLDLTELTRDHRRFLWYRMLAVALAGLLALGVAFAIARRMLASVQELSAALPGVAEGKYLPIRIVHTGDELERLAETWNRSCAQLKEADLWKRALGKYLSRAALESVKAGNLALGGTTLRATVLFSDIRGFTTLAEGMPPEKLLRILNRYFTEMVTAVIKNEGIVDKFIGDCIMAVWGPPTPGHNDALSALTAAVDMRRRLVILNREFAAQGLPELKCGIGIHTGEVVAGNMGSEGDDSNAGKMEYTVIGDTVNLASRLESLTKELHVDVLVSEDTIRQAGGSVPAKPIGEVKVRGREKPIQVYRVLDAAEVEAAS